MYISLHICVYSDWALTLINTVHAMRIQIHIYISINLHLYADEGIPGHLYSLLACAMSPGLSFTR